MKNNKKYYSISEVASYLGVSAPMLRYLEKTTSKFKVHQIRGRRYYTAENLAVLKEKYDFKEAPVVQMELPITSSSDIRLDQNEIIMKIAYLEKQFTHLRDMLLGGMACA